jgi:hypothetical protein
MRDGCGRCTTTPDHEVMAKNFGFVPRRYLITPDGSAGGSTWEKRLCPTCSSCWYIYEHVDGHVAAWHRACTHDDGTFHEISFEDGVEWEADPRCRYAKEATEAVREAARVALSERTRDGQDEDEPGDEGGTLDPGDDAGPDEVGVPGDDGGRDHGGDRRGD